MSRPDDNGTARFIATPWILSDTKIADVESIEKSVCRHVSKTLARSAGNMDTFAAYQAAALATRDRLIDSWNLTQQTHTQADVKRVYYLSLEFLLGRSLDNALLNLGIKDRFKEALSNLGFNVEDLVEEELDAALGNGGLGRLAACFMDSMATLDYPAWVRSVVHHTRFFLMKPRKFQIGLWNPILLWYLPAKTRRWLPTRVP